MTLADDAQRALLYEVVTCPKPGLVDPISSGPHPDMDVYLFIDSSLALRSYFETAEKIGKQFEGTDLTEMFQILRRAGQKAETTMYTATNGVNTHKGAIFSLGILVCAESYRLCHRESDVFSIVRHMTDHLVTRDFKKKLMAKPPVTAGEKQYYRYGLTGSRGQAQAGYPIVAEVALPFLRDAKGNLNERLLDTLMKIATRADDSSLIKRAHDPKIVTWLHQEAERYLALGGSQSEAGRQFLKRFDQYCLSHHYSLGGCADLLILTIFIGIRRQII